MHTYHGNHQENFFDQFYSIDQFEVVIELRSKTTENFSVRFPIEFNDLRMIGDDLSEIEPFDFPFIALRVSDGTPNAANKYYTSKDFWLKLMTMKALDKLMSQKKFTNSAPKQMDMRDLLRL